MLVSKNWLAEYVELPDHDTLVDRLTMTGLNHEGTETVGDDLSIDLEVTSNRADCLGHIGVAREISVLFEKPLNVPDPQPAASGKSLTDEFSVEIAATEHCSRFTARLIRGVKIGPSPDWLVKHLQAAIVKRNSDGTLEPYESVNNVVDISNYVMLECGQPLHTFDYDKLQGGKIVVREPNDGEKLEAINHNEYELQAGMCVIADGNRAVGLGGVMGGADTEVSDSTVNILIEAAHFNPMSIRSTARKLNLHSAASFRFERTINPNNLDWASRRCCELILQLAGGELAEGFIDAGQPPQPRQPIKFRFAQLDRILGIKIPRDKAVSILESLGFGRVLKQSIEGATGKAGGISLSINTADFDDKTKTDLLNDATEEITVIPPPWRLDVTREIDLVEEVGRIYGYENVPDNVDVPMAASVRSHRDRVVNKIRTCLTAAGIDEAMTASLVPEKWSNSFTEWSTETPLQSSQPMLGVLEKASQNLGQVNLLRRSLLPSLLEVFRINEHKQNQDIHLFEIAKVYLPRHQPLPAEPYKVGMISERGYSELKGVIETMVEHLNPAAILDTEHCDIEILDLTKSAELTINGTSFGWIGQVSEEGKALFGFSRDCTVGELDLEILVDHATEIALHGNVSPFPAITRDFNFVVDESVRWGDLAASVRQASGDLLESISYKETFRNTDKDGENKKRVLLSVVLRSVTATLTGEQAEQASRKIIATCGDNQAAKLLG